MAKTLSLGDDVAVSDAPFERSGGEIKRFPFELPGDLSTTNPAVLMFGITPDDDVRYIVLLNDDFSDPNNLPSDKIVDDQELHGATFRTLHEVIPGNKFRGGEGFTNLLDFRVVSGKAKIHDVVLLFQRNVTVLDS